MFKKKKEPGQPVTMIHGMLALSLVGAGKSIPVAIKVAGRVMDKWTDTPVREQDLPDLLFDLQRELTNPANYGPETSS